MTVANISGVEINAGTVLPEWIDFNGHMNVAYYVLAFDLGVDALWETFGITEDYIQSHNSSTFAVESHVMYLRELKLDDPYIVTAQILAYDKKRIHQFQRMYHATEGFLAATSEWMNLHVDLNARKVAPWPENILQGIHSVAKAQGELPYPAEAGHKMTIADPIYSASSGMA